DGRIYPDQIRLILASKPPPEGHEHRHDDDEHQPGREITHRAHPPFKGGAWHPALPSLNITTECRRCYWCLPDGRTARPPRNTAGRRSCSRGRTGTEERKNHPRTPRSTLRRTSSNCRSPASCRSLSFLPKLGFPPGQKLPERVGVQLRDSLGDGLDCPSRDAAHVGKRRRLTVPSLLLPVVHLLHELAVAQKLDALLLVRQQVRRRFVVGRQRRGVLVGGRRPLRGGRRGRGGRSSFAGVQPRPNLLAEFGAGFVEYGVGQEG